jgi:hypothetical protein
MVIFNLLPLLPSCSTIYLARSPQISIWNLNPQLSEEIKKTKQHLLKLSVIRVYKKMHNAYNLRTPLN